jgi:ATP-dependent DNA helicase RecG
MQFAIQSVASDQADRLVRFDEGQFGDVKAIEAKPGKLTEDISAFANADGGELFIGIDGEDATTGKQRRWRGFSNVEAANAHLQVFNELYPAGEDLHYEFLMAHLPGLVLHITVGKTRGVTLASSNIPYLRVGAQSIPQTSNEARRRLEYTFELFVYVFSFLLQLGLRRTCVSFGLPADLTGARKEGSNRVGGTMT